MAYEGQEWDPFRKVRIAGLGILLVLVLVIVLVLVRGSLSSPSPSEQTRRPGPTAAPTVAPSSLPPASAPVGSGTPSGWPGASRVVNGLPVGYADSQDGATAAAANYSTLFGGQLLLDPQAYRAAEAAAAAPAAQSTLMAEGEMRISDTDKVLGLAGNAAPGGAAAVVKYVPIAYAVESYQPSQALILVWGLSITGLDGRQPATQSWTTTRVALSWTGRDWKLSDLSIGPGPAPQLSQPPDSSTTLPPELNGFHPFRG